MTLTPARRLLPLLAGLAVVVALVAGLVLGRGLSSGAERVASPVDLGFAHDMKTHHAQAVAMSEIVHRRSTDPGVGYLAFDIMTTQQGQIGIMSGWLDVWGQAQGSTAPAMAWAGEGHEGPMPGMATAAEVEELNALPVPAMHEQYLRLMIRHHRGAVPMADIAAARADSTLTARLAKGMSEGQAAEVRLMQDMLRERGLSPEPEETGTHGGSHG